MADTGVWAGTLVGFAVGIGLQSMQAELEVEHWVTVEGGVGFGGFYWGRVGLCIKAKGGGVRRVGVGTPDQDGHVS